MKGKPIGGVRRAQLITTYGVGSLIAVGSESFMVTGLDRWPELGPYDQTIHERRLEKEFGVQCFRLPPASDSDKYGDIPVIRFPEIQSCPGCNRLAKAKFFGATRSPAKCKECDRELVPSRFVVCCTAGHIDDFPYFRWLHKGGDSNGSETQRHDLKLKATGRSASLGDIEISCSCGVRPVTMEGALGKGALKGISSCTGRRPWLGNVWQEDCDQFPRAMQRGASGVWFSDVRSALSIPPWSEGVHRFVQSHWRSLRKAPDIRERLEELELANHRLFSVEEIIQAVEQRREDDAGHTDSSEAALKSGEYQALTRTAEEKAGRQDFVCVPWPDDTIATELAVDQVMRVKRLREVRVLRGFTRLAAPSTASPSQRAPLYAAENRPDWLPAIEVIGEGVFLRLDADRLAEWESRPEVSARVAPIDIAYRERSARFGLTPDREITPRLVMIHTLAHSVINEWSLDSGYPTASLRERLYVSEKMSGILIYTATSDSAGSLGGIVAQVESGNLANSIRAALDRMSWCSSDPLCVESDTSGTDNLNRAACHSCVLLPETSCEEFNTLLDRALLIGDQEDSNLGFFSFV
ncbi:DrmB family protein [Streptosporangium jomthongense]|uniref:DrmB family protein n=1 Tax=Streptosporangium jomthongense TaxID=1193683 RepID=A0ABV8FAF4_9ACTN